MSFLDLIEAKRDGKEFSPEQMREAVMAFLPASGVPEYQLGAFLMALYLKGMTEEEVPRLSFALRDSGVVLTWPKEDRPVVDKHSTGGVGDKVTLPLVPLLACLGFRVPMISGRGLSITGGTLDKLDAVPGFRAAMSIEHMTQTVQSLGGVICGDSRDVAPADGVMYGLRDVTGTVDSIPITAASILSNKLAEGLNALVLDAKFGRGACTPAVDDARTLARAMVDLGNACGVSTRALLTDMEAPLGRAAGNWVEVRESVECLEGRGPRDLRAVTVELAAHLVVQTGKSSRLDEARTQAEAVLDSGEPRRRFDEILAAQGADIEAFHLKLSGGPTAPVVRDVLADRSGVVTNLDAYSVGALVRDLGAGRLTREDVLDYDVGVDRMRKPGDPVQAGEPLARIHARTEAKAEDAAARLRAAYTLGETSPTPRPLLLEVVA